MIEATTKLVTTVDDLPAAWGFVMAHLDRLGPDPRVHINPIWIMSVDHALSASDDRPNRQFEVTVSGTVRHEEAHNV